MKAHILIAAASFAFAASALAAPRLVVDTVVTEYFYDETSDQPKGSKVLARVHRLTESGKPVTVRAAGTEWTFTPTLLGDGSVDYAETLILHYEGPKARKADLPKRKPVFLGESLEVSVGTVAFSTKTSMAK